MKLLIGNRNYSSWSLRPWLVLKHFDIPFEDEVLQLQGEGFRAVLAQRSPTARVPVLEAGDLVIVETIAIIEYVADRFPDRAIWPVDIEQRALARQVLAQEVLQRCNRRVVDVNDFARFGVEVEIVTLILTTKVICRENITHRGGSSLQATRCASLSPRRLRRI